MEDSVVHRHVGFGFIDNDLLFVRIALAPGLDRERNEHATDFFVIANIGFHFLLRAVF